ncbi:acyltransferase, partial [Klebsiella michiganensis]
GKNIFINRAAMFVDLGGIIIEDNVLIGPRVNLLSVNHPELPMKRRGVLLAPITIKKFAWLGAGVTVLPGITIGENAIVAANATVTKDVPANAIVAGTPAKIIRWIQEDKEEI